jgi:hypothetical protein
MTSKSIRAEDTVIKHKYITQNLQHYLYKGSRFNSYFTFMETKGPKFLGAPGYDTAGNKQRQALAFAPEQLSILTGYFALTNRHVIATNLFDRSCGTFKIN